MSVSKMFPKHFTTKSMKLKPPVLPKVHKRCYASESMRRDIYLCYWWECVFPVNGRLASSTRVTHLIYPLADLHFQVVVMAYIQLVERQAGKGRYRDTETEREMFHPLFLSLKAHTSQVWNKSVRSSEFHSGLVSEQQEPVDLSHHLLLLSHTCRKLDQKRNSWNQSYDMWVSQEAA